ncbi:EF-hand domain-containing protein [Pseudoxanthomonas koreensis]|uniref:EF-hand domain-containing protein n=1 Tax=Pseudoxanthomonas koreensis TaxID=266061 RepID=UPI0035A64E87
MNHPRLFTGTLILGLAAVAPLAMAQTTPEEQQHPYAQGSQTPATGAVEQQPAHSSATGEGLSWAELDTDGNGSLNRQEAQRHAGMAHVFSAADANADGDLSGEEYRDYLQAQRNDPAQE